jgi:hypothetical protein
VDPDPVLRHTTIAPGSAVLETASSRPSPSKSASDAVQW